MRAARAYNDAVDRWLRAADAWEAATWVVARNPDVGRPLDTIGTLRALTLEGARSIDLPTLTIVYEIQPDLIVIRNARFETARAADIGNA
jgi:hypothetical protein